MDREFLFRIIGFILNFIVIYLIGSFIAWDFNPMDWLLFTTTFGRFIFLIIFMANIIGNFLSND